MPIKKVTKTVYTVNDKGAKGAIEFDTPEDALGYLNQEAISQTLTVYDIHGVAYHEWLIKHAGAIWRILDECIGQHRDGIIAPHGRDMGGAPLSAPVPSPVDIRENVRRVLAGTGVITGSSDAVLQNAETAAEEALKKGPREGRFLVSPPRNALGVLDFEDQE